jgi:hypothetical protein
MIPAIRRRFAFAALLVGAFGVYREPAPVAQQGRTVMNMMVASLLAICASVVAHAQTFSPEELKRRAVERRAIEAVNWGMSAVNTDLMLQQMLTKTGGKVNEVIYWSRPLDWRNQTLTPNLDAIYFQAFFNTKDVGPIVLEVPPAGEGGTLNGNIVDVWQIPLEDAGPSGADAGKGGKYLLLPPSYAGSVPEGYIALRPTTYASYALLRSNLKSHGAPEVAKSVAYGKQLKVYPLAQAANPPPTRFTDAANVLFDSTIRYDVTFFTSLDRIIQSEPCLPRDRAMIDVLRSIGIEKGKPFAPDAGIKSGLEAGAREARAWLASRYATGLPTFYEGGQWLMPANPEMMEAVKADFNDPERYPVDARGVTYTYAFIGIKRLGTGQFYLISISDRNGDAFDGAKIYRLNVPANPPIEQYWSLTAYDRETHALIRDMPRASRSSQIADMQKNADGSVDIYIGPSAPAGRDANWVPTDPKHPFELMFRAYAPTRAFFEKSWKLPDVEKVN